MATEEEQERPARAQDFQSMDVIISLGKIKTGQNTDTCRKSLHFSLGLEKKYHCFFPDRLSSPDSDTQSEKLILTRDLLYSCCLQFLPCTVTVATVIFPRGKIERILEVAHFLEGTQQTPLVNTRMWTAIIMCDMFVTSILEEFCFNNYLIVFEHIYYYALQPLNIPPSLYSC